MKPSSHSIPRRQRSSHPLPYWQEGWYQKARRVDSSNYNQRPPNTKVTLLVLHNISLPPGCFRGDAVEDFFTNTLVISEHPFYEEIASMQVSAHFFLRRDGKLIQFVSCDERAWHAGPSQWRGQHACNDFSIGVEIEGTDTIPYTQHQYRRLARLTTELRLAYPGLCGIAGHSEIAPERKTDPGPAFDWNHLMRIAKLPRKWRINGDKKE